MKKFLIALVAAMLVGATALATSSTAEARWGYGWGHPAWGYRGGWGYGGWRHGWGYGGWGYGALAAGAFVGAALAAPYYSYPYAPYPYYASYLITPGITATASAMGPVAAATERSVAAR